MNTMNSNLEKLAEDAFNYLDRNGMAETSGSWCCDAGWPVIPSAFLVVTTAKSDTEEFTFISVTSESAFPPKKNLIMTLVRIKTDDECTYAVINVGGCAFPAPIPVDVVERFCKDMKLNEVTKLIIRGCGIIIKAPHFTRLPEPSDAEKNEDEHILSDDDMYQKIKALYEWAEKNNVDGMIASPAEFGLGIAVARHKKTINISAGKIEVIDIDIYLWASIIDFEPKRMIGFRRVVTEEMNPQDDRLFAAITALDGQETPVGTFPMVLNAEGRKLLNKAIELVFIAPRWEQVD